MSTEVRSAYDINRPPSMNVEGGANPPLNESGAALKACDIQKHLHAHLLPAASRPLFTGASTGAIDCAGDYSYIIRQFFNDFNIDSPLFSTEGMTTACSSMTGAIGAVRAYDRFKEAAALGLKSGKVEASIDMVRGVSQGIAGTFYLGYRPLSITATILNMDRSSAHAATAIGRAAFITGGLGNLFFGGFYAALGLYFTYMLNNLYSFRGKFFQDRDIKKLESVENVQNFIKFLTEKRLEVSPETTLKKMLESHVNSPEKVGEKKVKEQLKATCMAATKTWINALIKEAKTLPEFASNSLSGKDSQKIAERIFEELDTFSEQKQAIIESLGFDKKFGLENPKLFAFVQTLSFAELLGLDLMATKREKKKEAKLAAFVGNSAMSALKKGMASGLIKRLESTDPVIQKNAMEEAAGIIKDAQSNMKSDLLCNWCLLISGVVGVIATIVSFVFTGPIGVIAANIFFSIVAVSMLPPDLIGLKNSQDAQDQTGRFDKAVLWISTIVGVLSLIGVIGLSVFTMGVAPAAIAIVTMVVSLVIGLLWLGSNSYSLYRLYKMEEMFGFNNPTFESLAEKIQVKTGEERICQRMMQRIKKLSVSERKALKAAAKGLGLIDSSEDRSLSASDQKLDRAFDFGREFFLGHTEDAAVLRAVEKAYESLNSETLRGLYERLMKVSKASDEKKAEALASIRDFFNTKLSKEEQSLVAERVYKKRAKKASSRSFESIKLIDLKKALLAAGSRKKEENDSSRLKLLQHSITMFSGLHRPAVA